MRQPTLHVLDCSRVIEHCKHCVQDQDRVLRLPGLRVYTQNEVLERLCVKAGKTGVDTLGITLEDRRLGCRQGRNGVLSPAAKAMKAKPFVDSQGSGAHYLRQLTSGLASNQVDLEEAILPVSKPCGKRKIGSVARRNRRHAGSITFDCCSGRQAVDGQLTVKLRQAGSEHKPRENKQNDDGETDT